MKNSENLRIYTSLFIASCHIKSLFQAFVTVAFQLLWYKRLKLEWSSSESNRLMWNWKLRIPPPAGVSSHSLLKLLFQISPRCQRQPPRQVNTQNYGACARLSAPHQISISASQCFPSRLSLTAIKAVLADGTREDKLTVRAIMPRSSVGVRCSPGDFTQRADSWEMGNIFVRHREANATRPPPSSLKGVRVNKTSANTRAGRSRKVRHPPKQKVFK